MKRKYKYLFLILIAASAAAVGTLAAMHYWRVNTPALTFNGDRGVGVKIDDVHYTSARKGRVEWVLDAKSATRYKNGNLMALDTVKLVFHNKNNVPYTMTAKEALYNETAGEIDASGGVTVSSEEGYSLKTERLKYNSRTARITSSDTVEITTGGMKVTGDGLLIDLNKEQLFLFKDVRAIIVDKTV
ncbi:MAG: LPS export ABC transporter periplasmic protein LptC [Deltaproteobacteria bacterium]|nr:LPS export ABC transporter periplasmic protein LptC [Deltaproteobacteria bacterium]